jgi:hypothetical protein
LPPWQLEIIRFPSTAREIALALGVESPPDCRIEHGRIFLTFRRLKAARWSESEQIEYAARVANVARSVCASDDRRQLRRAAKFATVVVFEDASIVNGCAVVARWECVVPAGW